MGRGRWLRPTYLFLGGVPVWYNTVPTTVPVLSWLFGVADLFDHTLRAVLSQPALASFVGVGVLMLGFGLFNLFWRGRRR